MTDALSAGLARTVLGRCADLARETEEPGRITRTFLSAPMRGVHDQLRALAARLGMSCEVDAAGNLRAVYPARGEDAPTLIIGSHLDTVPGAGAFDGILGVVLGFTLVEGLCGAVLNYQIEVIGFSEEEGVRFGAPFFGSRALIGRAGEMLSLTDAAGVSLARAVEDFGLDVRQLPRAALGGGYLGYLEFHNEQGPRLADEGAPLGLVDAIAGQSRLNVSFGGQANHAGTTPMQLRHDALCGAAQFVLTVERVARETPGLVATVGQLQVRPGAINVIPGEVTLSLDLRHARDEVRHASLDTLRDLAGRGASERGLTVAWTPRSEQAAVPMDGHLRRLLRDAFTALGVQAPDLTSGAGHDAMIVAERLPTAMVFLRSPDGLSHHPDESVLEEDVELALRVGLDFLRRLNSEVGGAEVGGRNRCTTS